MNASIGVYLRDNEFIVVPKGGGGGLYYELDEVHIAEATPDLQVAIERALRSSAEAFGRPLPDLTTRNWPLLKHLRLRSVRQFYTNVAYCDVFVDDSRVEVFPYAPRRDGRGFELSATVGSFVVDAHELASTVTRVLSESVRMNPTWGGEPP
jgi:hypothetical protein